VELSNCPVFEDSADFAGFDLTVANYFDDIAGEPVILDRRASFFEGRADASGLILCPRFPI
jgi:hypothetical protein